MGDTSVASAWVFCGEIWFPEDEVIALASERRDRNGIAGVGDDGLHDVGRGAVSDDRNEEVCVWNQVPVRHGGAQKRKGSGNNPEPPTIGARSRPKMMSDIGILPSLGSVSFAISAKALRYAS